MKKTQILVTGSSGYIGSNLIRTLQDEHCITGIDMVPGEYTDIVCDLSVKDCVKAIKLEHIDCIIHLAALVRVGESSVRPSKYWSNNVVATLNLLDAIRPHDIDFVFMSSAAVYKSSESSSLTTNSPLEPSSVYGHTKLTCEQMINSYCKAYGINVTILRLFNAGGGHRDPNRIQHLIPIALKCLKEEREFQIFGSDYDTEDGTCVRSYVHVDDIIRHCQRAMELMSGGLIDDEPKIFNVTTGNDYSVLEVIAAIEKITGMTLIKKFSDRRVGDPAILLGKRSSHGNFIMPTGKLQLEDIIKDEWKSLNSK